MDVCIRYLIMVQVNCIPYKFEHLLSSFQARKLDIYFESVEKLMSKVALVSVTMLSFVHLIFFTNYSDTGIAIIY